MPLNTYKKGRKKPPATSWSFAELLGIDLSWIFLTDEFMDSRRLIQDCVIQYRLHGKIDLVPSRNRIAICNEMRDRLCWCFPICRVCFMLTSCDVCATSSASLAEGNQFGKSGVIIHARIFRLTSIQVTLGTTVAPSSNKFQSTSNDKGETGLKNLKVLSQPMLGLNPGPSGNYIHVFTPYM
ncbi:hypothetical protein LOTGIDRAFT_167947 [Lottia gigantea]|uniref:Uncharacterized protein n=1 Tax=Lottia gigantea TaxID=225164 RepID=V3ZW37_LOTGI|nr:hypothetical protein LOTGIDRAFT_167947 [Lottia gigantea]ESO85161.1 hypothetical protein LOTGIDRAFT_167947 [Lottia gigantea]